MMNKARPTHKYLILLAITALTISAMACNLMKLVDETQYDDRRPGEGEDYREEDAYGQEEPRDEGEEYRHEDEPNLSEGDEFHHELEPFHGEEESRHEGEPHQGEPHPGEECPPESECPHEPEGHHEGEEFHHEGESPPGEECPPESECPRQPEGHQGEGADVRTDLAVTDIFPENLPFGDLKLRITNHGPTPLTTYPAEIICHAHGVSWGGPEHGQEDRESHQQIILSLGPGDTDEFEAGITIDANLYQYEVVCEVWADIDPEHHNNVYMEMVPSSNGSP
jgi:hypothetical protein